MATTTATIDIVSQDWSKNYEINLNAPMDLFKHNTTGTGLLQMNYHKAVIPTGTNFTLIQESAALNSNPANYVYIANNNTDPEDYVIISIQNEVIGRLYSGDWAFFPWSNATTATAGVDDPSGNDTDIEIQAVTHECIVEYALFHSGETLLTASDS
jgi:hypothetical protein